MEPSLNGASRAFQIRRSLRHWRLVTGMVAAAGLLLAALAAAWIARRDADQARAELETSAAEIISTLELALQREADFVIDTGGYLSTTTDLTAADFHQWVAATGVLERYPEVELVGVATITPAEELDHFLERAEQDASGPTPADGTIELIPPGERPFYCLFLGQVARNEAFLQPAGLDLCAIDPTGELLRAREENEPTYTVFALGDIEALVVLSPVYQGGIAPDTVAARRAEHLGWVGTVIVPTVILEQALGGHDDYAIKIRYLDTDIQFSAGDADRGADALTSNLGDSWNVTVLGPHGAGSIAGNVDALALLGAVGALGLVLAGFIYVLGSGRARARRLVAERTDQLRHQALHDSLTGLPNRALILDRIEQLLARSRRSGTIGAALFLDLDGFKTINDTLGHAIGDRLLQAVAARLRSTLRDVDTIGRLGGDEFVVLIDDCETPEAAELVGDRILGALREPFAVTDVARPINAGASIGIAVGHRDDPGDLLRDADVALYEAKAAGRSCYRMFQAGMATDTHRRFELGVRLRSSIADEQLRVAYQPIYDLQDLHLEAAEARLTLDDPELGLVPASELVPLLEASGQIDEVGAWMLHEACRQVAAWRDAGAKLGAVVGISGRQLASSDLATDVDHALAGSGLDPSALTVTFPKEVLARDLRAASRSLQKIKATGVNVAIDGFGSSYASLDYLRRLPVDAVKVDRHLTSSVERSKELDAIVNSLVQLGDELGLTTLAERAHLTCRPDGADDNHGDPTTPEPLDAPTFEATLLQLGIANFQS